MQDSITHEALEACTLADCPPGLFLFNGTLGFKSEYITTLENPRRYQCDAYVVESGEYFHGGAKDTQERAALIVTPIRTGQLIHAQPSGPDRYPLRACVWKRRPYDGCPQGEWVLEIEGQINDMSFVSRHTEPLTTPPEEVPGLPSLYAAQPSGDEVEAVKAGLRECFDSERPGDDDKALTLLATAAITALDAVRKARENGDG